MIQIESLTLQIPGVDAETGRRLADTVARRLADALPDIRQNRDIGSLHVPIRIPPGTDFHRTAELITQAIVRQLTTD